jgi:hypothetical protein
MRPPDEATVRLLIDAGANVSVTAPFSQTILHAATSDGMADMDEYLMVRGVDNTAAGWGNHAPLHDAASQ